MQLLAAGAIYTTMMWNIILPVHFRLGPLVLVTHQYQGGGEDLLGLVERLLTSWNSGELLRTALAGAEFPYVGFRSLRQSTFQAGNRLLQ